MNSKLFRFLLLVFFFVLYNNIVIGLDAIASPAKVVSLQAKDKDIVDILSEAADKVGYDLFIHGEVPGKKTISFKNAPLDVLFARTLKGVDYSVSYDDKQKKIDVYLLKKGSKVAKGSIDRRSTSGSAGTGVMAGADEAMVAFLEAERAGNLQPVPRGDGGVMAGADEAQVAFRKAEHVGNLQPVPQGDGGVMAGADEAQAAFRKAEHAGKLQPVPQGDGGVMAGSDKVMSDFINKK